MLPASTLLLATLLFAQEGPDTIPLFAADDPVELTLVGDLNALRKDRSEEPEDRPAFVVLASGDTVQAEIRPRGNFRRDPSNCTFPPIRLDVKGKSAKGTVFEGQDKLKIVASCRPERDNYEQYVLLEYALYKVFRLLTDQSFQVRLARITFVDTGGGRDPFTTSAFFIEDDDAVAARMGGRSVDLPEGAGVASGMLSPRETTRVSIFQYMIGNTDYSDQALHNAKLIQSPGSVIPVPYDFDWSGLVNTPYAVPDPRLGTKTVRERLYRGWCYDPSTRAGLLDEFRNTRADVEAIFTSVPGLSEKSAKNAISYLKDFYSTIETDDRAERRMFRDCRKIH